MAGHALRFGTMVCSASLALNRERGAVINICEDPAQPVTDGLHLIPGGNPSIHLVRGTPCLPFI
jgi:hypothetical protein